LAIRAAYRNRFSAAKPAMWLDLPLPEFVERIGAGQNREEGYSVRVWLGC
jgi:hypothetical protein